MSKVHVYRKKMSSGWGYLDSTESGLKLDVLHCKTEAESQETE